MVGKQDDFVVCCCEKKSYNNVKIGRLSESQKPKQTQVVTNNLWINEKFLIYHILKDTNVGRINDDINSGPIEIVEPVGKRLLIRKDEDKKETKGGIKLPDNIEIPTITGRIVAVSAEVENMPEVPLVQYDKVLFNPKGAVPVDFEGNNRLFVVDVENVVAVFRKDAV